MLLLEEKQGGLLSTYIKKTITERIRGTHNKQLSRWKTDRKTRATRIQVAENNP